MYSPTSYLFITSVIVFICFGVYIVSQATYVTPLHCVLSLSQNPVEYIFFYLFNIAFYNLLRFL
jgi:hypothetical protein